MRQNAHGCIGQVDFADLAAQYRRAVAEGDPKLQQLKAYDQACRLSFRSKRSSRSQSTYGLTTRGAARLAMKLKRQSLWRSTHTQAPQDRAATLVAAAGSQTSLQEAVSTCRKQQQLDGVRKRQAVQENLSVLHKYVAERGPRILATLNRLVPSVDWASLGASPLPSCSGLMVFLPPQYFGAATDGLAWASRSQRTNVGATLQREWEDGHVVIQDSVCRPIPPEQAPQGQRCMKAGTCLCSVEGLGLWRMRNCILLQFKQAFKSKADKSELMAGSVVIRFVRSKPCTTCGLTEVAGDLWMHVSHMHFSPYQPSLQVLEVAEPPFALPGDMERTWLKACLCLTLPTPPSGLYLNTLSV